MSKVTVEVDDQKLWDAVTSSGFGTMPWYQETFIMASRLGVEVDDPDDELGVEVPITMRLTVADLAKGLQIAIDKGVVDPLTGLSLTDWVLGEADMDAVLGDLVVQCAVFGQSIYG